MERPRPAAVTVIAILHLVIGGLGVLCLPLNLVGGNAGNPFQPPEQRQQMEQLQKALETKAPMYGAYRAVIEILFPIGLTAALIAAGIGLLKWQAWGWTLSIGYALASLLHKFVGGVYAMLFLVPIMTDWAKTFVANQPGMNPAAQAQAESIMVTVVAATMIGAPCVSMIYPVAVLIVMSLGSVRQALAEGAGGAADNAAGGEREY